MIVNVAVVALPGTVTLAGTDTARGLLLVRAMTMPVVGALSLRVNVPVDVVPPITEVGLNQKPESTGGFMVRVAVMLTVPAEAVIATAVWVATGVVMIVNVADVLPAATVTLAGTVATEGFALESAMTNPPVGAARVNLTVPVEVLPPTRDIGLNDKVERVGLGVTVN